MKIITGLIIWILFGIVQTATAESGTYLTICIYSYTYILFRLEKKLITSGANVSRIFITILVRSIIGQNVQQIGNSRLNHKGQSKFNNTNILSARMIPMFLSFGIRTQ